MVLQKIFGVERDLDIPPEDCCEDEIQKMEDTLPECEHGWFESVFEKAQLHYRVLLPKATKPKAIVIYMHGISTHGGKCGKIDGRQLNSGLLAEAYLKKGYAFYAFDLYGHGYSEGKRFYIPNGDWEVNKKDLINFINLVASKHPEDTPLFLLGESYGCTLCIHAAKQFQENPSSLPRAFNSIILTGPAIIGDLPPYPVLLVLRYLLAPIWPEWTPFFMPNTVSPDRIWEDSRVVKMRTDPKFLALRVDGSGLPFRLGTGVGLLNALEHVRNVAIPGFKVPFCILHGTKDYAVPISGSELMWEKVETPKEDRIFHRIEGAYHDLFAGPQAEDCTQKTVDWIEARLAKLS